MKGLIVGVSVSLLSSAAFAAPCVPLSAAAPVKVAAARPAVHAAAAPRKVVVARKAVGPEIGTPAAAPVRKPVVKRKVAAPARPKAAPVAANCDDPVMVMAAADAPALSAAPAGAVPASPFAGRLVQAGGGVPSVQGGGGILARAAAVATDSGGFGVAGGGMGAIAAAGATSGVVPAEASTKPAPGSMGADMPGAAASLAGGGGTTDPLKTLCQQVALPDGSCNLVSLPTTPSAGLQPDDPATWTPVAGTPGTSDDTGRVPVPGVALLLGLGGFAMGWLRRR